MSSRVGARAPSNIALIKYMGKKDAVSNLPENGSLSLTLDRLCTFAEIQFEQSHSASACWRDELPGSAVKDAASRVPALDDSGIAKVLRHIERVRRSAADLLPSFGVQVDPARIRSGNFVLRAANTFPEASGIASSASAFAAITLASAAACARELAAFEKAYDGDSALRRALARISRQGSGSSCRSFEGPWVEWEGEETIAVDAKTPALAHFVLIVSDRPKRVSSSRAHLLVKSSPLWEGRIARVQRRKEDLKSALKNGDLPAASRIAWQEAWEMHSLFHTCSEPFSYWEPGTTRVLQELAPRLGQLAPPIVTLDAGPNVHLSVEAAHSKRWLAELEAAFPDARILEDRPGSGAELLMEKGGAG